MSGLKLVLAELGSYVHKLIEAENWTLKDATEQLGIGKTQLHGLTANGIWPKGKWRTLLPQLRKGFGDKFDTKIWIDKIQSAERQEAGETEEDNSVVAFPGPKAVSVLFGNIRIDHSTGIKQLSREVAMSNRQYDATDWKGYVSAICGSGINGVDSFSVWDFNTKQKNCHIIQRISLEKAHESRKPGADDMADLTQDLEDDLRVIIPFMAPALLTPGLANFPVVFPVRQAWVALMAMDPESGRSSHDYEHGGLEIFCYLGLMNFSVVDTKLGLSPLDMESRIRSLSLRVNKKMSAFYRQFIGSVHHNQIGAKP